MTARSPQNGRQAPSERVLPGQRDALPAALVLLAELISTSPHNLVSRRQRQGLLEDHIQEAVATAQRLPVTPGTRWLDLGTGGGLPGLVCAQQHPSARWVMLDATAKKIAEVERFSATLALRNTVTVAARAEELAWDADHRGAYDGVVSRAVAPLPTLVELARGFLRPGGILAAVKGPTWAAELAAAEPAIRQLRFGSSTAARVDRAARPTWLVTMRAVGPPPAQFPRRNGLPRSNPLGVSG